MVNSEVIENKYEVLTLKENFDTKFAQDLIRGFKSNPKFIRPVYLYDKIGSQLFEEICQLPEYYPTRSETEILKNYSVEIANYFKDDITLVELGSGSSIKTDYLIKAFLSVAENVEYIPIDVSGTILKESAVTLNQTYPTLIVNPIVALYEDGISQIENNFNKTKLILWLGSSIGNFDREDAVAFIQQICENLQVSDRLLIGIDLDKKKAILEKAYNDSAGITAKFNLNLLRRINNEFGADFILNNFRHKAIFNKKKGRIEMHLISNCKQKVFLSDLDLDVTVKKNEAIHTENSYKYTQTQIEKFSEGAGLKLVKQWFDSKQWFSLNLFEIPV
jgi:dimethylhistidine N-methyltransferase